MLRLDQEILTEIRGLSAEQSALNARKQEVSKRVQELLIPSHLAREDDIPFPERGAEPGAGFCVPRPDLGLEPSANRPYP
jgi:hypothetical protein